MPVHTCVTESVWNGGCICHWGAFFFLFWACTFGGSFMYLVFSRMPGGVTVGDLGLLLCPSSFEHYEVPLLIVG